MSKLLSDEIVQTAFDWLLKSSDEIAMARGNTIRAEFKAKKVFARLFMLADGSVEARKSWAQCHDEYAVAMENVAVAEETWERARDQRNRAELIIEAYRTMEASERAVGKMR